MQIDVLSQNTLKLTLSRLDMFDLDIKYESLSSKNPDTKKLLSHVLQTVRLDKSTGVDFSGERLFVEAFPRPDGGCMLYISCLESESANNSHEKRTVRLTARKSPHAAQQSKKSNLLCRIDSIKALGGLCKSLTWQISHGRLELESALYADSGEYRLLVSGNDNKLISAIISEYGELLNPEKEQSLTCEHYKMLVAENAVEKMNSVL